MNLLIDPTVAHMGFRNSEKKFSGFTTSLIERMVLNYNSKFKGYNLKKFKPIHLLIHYSFSSHLSVYIINWSS